MLNPDDLDNYDWGWDAKYGDDVIAEMSSVFEEAAVLVAPDLSPAQLQTLSSEWAQERAGELLKVDGSLSLAATTKLQVKQLVSTTIANGESLGTLSKNLRADPIFSRARAQLVARTETTEALGQGGKQAAANTGKTEKRWYSQGDGCDACADNDAAGWIPIDEPFPSGDDTIGDHPNCECNVVYRSHGG